MTTDSTVSTNVVTAASECVYFPGMLPATWQLIECYRPIRGRFVRTQLQSVGAYETTFALYELLVYGI